MDPLEHRVLLMLPSVYRLWGKTRLRHLEPWVAEWTVDELYAGVGGQGTEGASYATAVLLENLQLKNEYTTGGVADISQGFDQVLRPLI